MHTHLQDTFFSKSTNPPPPPPSEVNGRPLSAGEQFDGALLCVRIYTQKRDFCTRCHL